MNFEYKRDLNHNYLILTGKQQDRENYQSKMMERNTVHGILPCSVRYVEDIVKYYYDISSKQPLTAAFSIRKMNYQLVSSIFMQMEQIFHELDNYLLDSSRILMDAHYMYWDVEAEKIHLIFFPQKKEENSVQKFAEEFLNLVDYADKKAVDAVYWFYQKATAENFTLCEMFTYFREQNAGMGVETGMSGTQGADAKDEPQSRVTGIRGGSNMQRSGAERQEKSGNVQDERRDYEEGGQNFNIEDVDIEDDDIEEADERLQRLKRLLPAAFCAAIFAAAGYILTHYKLTVNEMLAGCGFLAMIPTAFLVHLVRKWQKRIAERKAKAAVECQSGERSMAIKMRISGKENMKYREESVWEEAGVKEQISRAGGKTAETQKADPVYGETTYFGAEGWQQERCLEGRYKGKEILIAINETPFVIGKLQGAVSFVLSDVTVSRMHAQFIEKDGKLFLQDMNSKNGTYKNGVAMTAEEEAEVRPGDEIRFGRLRFTYH